MQFTDYQDTVGGCINFQYYLLWLITDHIYGHLIGSACREDKVGLLFKDHGARGIKARIGQPTKSLPVICAVHDEISHPGTRIRLLELVKKPGLPLMINGRSYCGRDRKLLPVGEDVFYSKQLVDPCLIGHR